MDIRPEQQPQRKRTTYPPHTLAPKQVDRIMYMRQKEQLADICGIKDCIMDGGYHGTPMCEDHAWQVWATLDAIKECDGQWEQARKNLAEYEAKQDMEARIQAAKRQSTWKTQRWIEPGWVYYLEVGELVKIGYTKDMERRMKQYPPNSTLLAVHPGTPKVEREMHHKFLHLLNKGREWFAMADDLEEHINQVRQQFKQDAA